MFRSERKPPFRIVQLYAPDPVNDEHIGSRVYYFCLIEFSRHVFNRSIGGRPLSVIARYFVERASDL
jgi:hypothetical protein